MKETTVQIPHRWDIWTADFDLLSKESADSLLAKKHRRRPVVVVAEEDDGRVTVVPLSTKISLAQKKTHIYMSNGCLFEKCRALCECVCTISTGNLHNHIGSVDDSFERVAIRHALSLHFGIADIVRE